MIPVKKAANSEPESRPLATSTPPYQMTNAKAKNWRKEINGSAIDFTLAPV